MKAAEVDSQGTQAIPEEARVEEFLNTAREKGATVIEEPRGRPIFQFFLAKGKTAPVLTFFDDDCSDAGMQEGVHGEKGW